MKQFLMIIGLSLMLSLHVNASNYYVRSDINGGTVTWTATSNPSDIFTFDTSIPNTDCAGCVTSWPDIADNIYNYSGQTLVIEADAAGLIDGEVYAGIFRNRYAGSRVESYADKFYVGRYLQVYDTAEPDSYIQNLNPKFIGSASDWRIYGTVTVGNFNTTETTLPINFLTNSSMTTVVTLTGLLTYNQTVTVPSTCELIVDRGLYLGDYTTDYEHEVYPQSYWNNNPQKEAPREINPHYGRLYPDGGTFVGDVTYKMAGKWNDITYFPRQTSVTGSMSGACCNQRRFVHFGLPFAGITGADYEANGAWTQGVLGVTDPYAGTQYAGIIYEDDSDDYPTVYGGSWSYGMSGSEGQHGFPFYIDENYFVTGNTTQGNYNNRTLASTTAEMKRGTGWVTHMPDANMTTYRVTSQYTPTNPVPDFNPDYSGSVDFTTFTFDVTYSNLHPGTVDEDENFAGRNLISNPYLSSIQWDDDQNGWNATNIDPTIHVATFTQGDEWAWWNSGSVIGGGDKYDLDSYNANLGWGTGQLEDGVIPVGGAFYVRATGSNPSLSVSSSALTTADPGNMSAGAGDPIQGFGPPPSSWASKVSFVLNGDESALITINGATPGDDYLYDMREPSIATAGNAYIAYGSTTNPSDQSSPAPNLKNIATVVAPITSTTAWMANIFVKKEVADNAGAHFSEWDIEMANGVYAYFTKDAGLSNANWNMLNGGLEGTLEGSNPDYFGDVYQTGLTQDVDGDGYVFVGRIVFTKNYRLESYNFAQKDENVTSAFDVQIKSNDHSHTIAVDKYAEYKINIMDMSGKILIQDSFNGFEYQFNTSEFSSGIYIYQVQSIDGLEAGKLIVR